MTDQTIPGRGNLGVLDGMHHEMERFFRRQHAEGGPIGPDGPGWPRENLEAQNGHGLNMIPPFLPTVTRHVAIATTVLRPVYEQECREDASRTVTVAPAVASVSTGKQRGRQQTSGGGASLG